MADDDDREFDALLAAHGDVRGALRAESASDQPSAALDAAILAASRRAVAAGPVGVDRGRRFASRWAVPLSAAAVMVLATSVSLLVYEERGTPSSPDDVRSATAPSAPAPAAIEAPSTSERHEIVRSDERPNASIASQEAKRRAPAPGPARPLEPSDGSSDAAVPSQSSVPVTIPEVEPRVESLATRKAAEAAKRSSAALEERERREDMASARRDLEVGSAPSAAVPPPQAVASGDQRDAAAPTPMRSAPHAAKAAVAEADRASNVASEAPMVAEPTARERSAAPAVAARQRAVGSSPAEAAPAAWIARIRTLLAAGELDAARVEVARLRCRHPDVLLPADLPTPMGGVACSAAPAKEGIPEIR